MTFISPSEKKYTCPLPSPNYARMIKEEKLSMIFFILCTTKYINYKLNANKIIKTSNLCYDIEW